MHKIWHVVLQEHFWIQKSPTPTHQASKVSSHSRQKVTAGGATQVICLALRPLNSKIGTPPTKGASVQLECVFTLPHMRDVLLNYIVQITDFLVKRLGDNYKIVNVASIAPCVIARFYGTVQGGKCHIREETARQRTYRNSSTPFDTSDTGCTLLE